MDYRLDLYNSVEKFINQMDDDDSIFIIVNNKKEGDLFMGTDGDINILSAVMSNNGYVNIDSEDKNMKHKHMQSCVLNMAINILRVDEDFRNKFFSAMELIKY